MPSKRPQTFPATLWTVRSVYSRYGRLFVGMELVEQGYDALLNVVSNLPNLVHLLSIWVVVCPVADINRFRIKFERRTAHGRDDVTRFEFACRDFLRRPLGDGGQQYYRATPRSPRSARQTLARDQRRDKQANRSGIRSVNWGWLLLSTTDEDVLDVAEALGEKLTQTQSKATESEFETILQECNEGISEQTGIQYDDACDTGGCC